MIARGRAGDTAASAHRRRLAQDMREAREKLTSSTGGRRTFDVELLRGFAERHRRAGPATAALAVAVAGAATAWVPAVAVLAWLSLLCPGIALLSRWSGRFLAEADQKPDHARWQRRFVLGEAAAGIGWASIALPFLDVRGPAAQAFVTVVLLLVGARAALLSSGVPPAVYASLGPVAVAVPVFLHAGGGDAALPLLALTGGALAFFVVLARRLSATALETLSVQAEKDALIVELDQARLNSDEARRRAEEASLAKSRFLATMSHELRTPLNAILGFSEVMKGELFGPHAVAAYRDYAEDIHASGQHLLTLINEILDLSRVEAGRYELAETAIALAQVVEECRHLLTLRARKRGIDLVEAVEPRLPRLRADERAIRQVVLNLLSNAIKFTPQGGTVTLKVGWTAQGGQYVSIKDTGPGIPEAEIPMIMSPFGRGSLAQKNAEEGSGLGLPIVKGLVDLHGGTFTLRSVVREGTEVVVILPPGRVIDPGPDAEPGASGPRHARTAA